MSLSAHLLIRITVVGVLCWLAVSLGLVWQLRQQGQADIDAQADHLATLTEQQLRRQLVALDAGSREPDLSRVAAQFGRPVCLRYQAHDVSHSLRWGCEAPAGHSTAPGWLERWLSDSGALPRQVQRPVTLWAARDGTLTVEPLLPPLIEDLWRRLRDLAALTAATIVAVNLGVWLTLRRLLRPAHQVLQALDRLAAGDLDTRPTACGPREFRQIGRHVDGLRLALARLTAQRTELTARLIDRQEGERRELARELHDEMGQGLAALQAISGGIRMSAQALEPARTDDTEALDDTIEQLHGGLRALLGRLRPPLLESQGLAFALRELVQAWNARQRLGGPGALQAVLVLPALDDWAAALPEAASLALYRAAQEALTNAARYAEPSEPVRLTLAANQGLTLTACNARAPQPATSSGTGRGLAMLAERLHAIGGTLHIDPGSAATFALRVHWPLAPA